MRLTNNSATFWQTTIGSAILVTVALLVPTRESLAQNPAPSRHASANNDQSLADGRQTFEGRCAGCHGLDGRGGERAPDIATRAVVQQRSDAMLYEIIKGGVPNAGMPAFPSLDDGSTKALIAYLRVLQGKGPATTIPGNPRNGEALFSGKARCSECHMLNGKGGFIASDLSTFGRGRSPAEIHDAITKPRADTRANAVVLVTTRSGDRLTGVVRNEDNFSLQLQALDGSFHLLMKPDIEKLSPQANSLMPADYATSLTPRELDDLVGFLMTVANKNQASVAKKESPDDDEDE
jgi:cytochrome c oxidase cbb3-type subunit III